METPWYDTKENMEATLDKGIEGLWEIAKARNEAGYKKGDRMNEWCLLGLFYLDSCGNFSKIVEGAPKHGYRYWKVEGEPYEVPRVISRDEMQQYTSRWTSELSLCIPPVGAVCDRCGDGWNLDNIEDHHAPRDRDKPNRHRRCQILAVIEAEQEEIRSILDRSEIPYEKMVAIPNRYHPNPDPVYYAPWFMVHTPKGRILIGWRKRVISIDWSRSNLVAQGSEVVDNPDVTHWAKGVHCYGDERAIEALRRLWTRG